MLNSAETLVFRKIPLYYYFVLLLCWLIKSIVVLLSLIWRPVEIFSFWEIPIKFRGHMQVFYRYCIFVFEMVSFNCLKVIDESVFFILDISNQTLNPLNVISPAISHSNSSLLYAYSTNTRRYLDVDSTFFVCERYTDVKTTLCAYWWVLW